MSYNTLYENETEHIIDVSYRKSYRSSTSKKEIKHCIESTVLAGSSLKSEVGFSCSYNQRSFLSLYYYNGPVILQLIDDAMSTYPCSITQNIGDTVEICYDSIEKDVVIIKDNEKCQMKLTFDNPNTWFAYADHGDDGQSNTISVNLGMKPFHNKVPTGFSKWISYSTPSTCKHNIHILVKFQMISLFCNILMISAK